MGMAMVVLGRVWERIWARGADLGCVVWARKRVVSGRVGGKGDKAQGRGRERLRQKSCNRAGKSTWPQVERLPWRQGPGTRDQGPGKKTACCVPCGPE